MSVSRPEGLSEFVNRLGREFRTERFVSRFFEEVQYCLGRYRSQLQKRERLIAPSLSLKAGLSSAKPSLVLVHVTFGRLALRRTELVRAPLGGDSESAGRDSCDRSEAPDG
jgi:hypothetical protein